MAPRPRPRAGPLARRLGPLGRDGPGGPLRGPGGVPAAPAHRPDRQDQVGLRAGAGAQGHVPGVVLDIRVQPGAYAGPRHLLPLCTRIRSLPTATSCKWHFTFAFSTIFGKPFIDSNILRDIIYILYILSSF